MAYQATSRDTATMHPGLLKELFTAWPKFSGSIDYPVSEGNKTDPLITWHHYVVNRKDLWDRNTTYGNNRRDLLVWMMNELTGELDRRAKIKIPQVRWSI
ncbi:MAG: hypothetical protein ACK5LG_21815 [Bacteroides thetaiotaomicron]